MDGNYLMVELEYLNFPYHNIIILEEYSFANKNYSLISWIDENENVNRQ